MESYLPAQNAALRRSADLEAEIRRRPSAFRILTGDRPTGRLHVGHLFGSLRNRVRLQSLGVEVIVLVADYQVLTDRRGGPDLTDAIRGQVADYLAAGIDPDRSLIFAHSAVPQIAELMLPFLALVSDAQLHRNPTVKAEIEATGRPPNGLLLTYPVHQAADILFCHANLVPVGLDQLPHLELTRVIARRFNTRYGEVFPVPDALLSATPLVPGLDGMKMSKSRGNTIALAATDDETARIIRRAPTDAERHISYEPDRRPGVAALLDLLAVVRGEPATAVAEHIGAGGAARLKRELTEAVNEVLRPLRVRRRELDTHPDYLDEVLRRGNARAREIAAATLGDVHRALGLAVYT
jgi:tryptophanyl-tRNA synthetase